MGRGQLSLVRVTSLECDIAKLIPHVAERLKKEGYGKLTKAEIALALSSKACERAKRNWEDSI